MKTQTKAVCSTVFITLLSGVMESAGTGNSGASDGDKGRLPTFKAPRDLSLSGKVNPLLRSRKTFIPNIPPKRDRASTDSSSASSRSPSTSAKSSPPQSRDSSRNRGRGRGGRDNAGERKKPDLIQASSIFSGGIGDGAKGSRVGSRGSRFGGRGGRDTGDGNDSGQKGGAKGRGRFGDAEKFLRDRDDDAGKMLEGNLTFLEVQAKVHEIIGDGRFIADLDEDEVDMERSLHAVELPMANYLTASLEERKKSIPVPLSRELFDSQIKVVPPDEPPIVADVDQLDPLSFAHTVLAAPPEGTIILFQMPDQLPVLDNTVTETGEVKEAKLATQIGSLPEGYIGKMQIFASGATRLLLGENSFEIIPGKPVSFRQELVAVDLEEKTMTALGPVQNKFLVIPDLEELFRQTL